jgi:Cu-processing system permease protein
MSIDLMPPLFPVAALTIRDLFRRRVFFTLGLFALLMVLLSFPLRQLTTGQWTRLITDVGFGSTDLCTTLLGIFLGASLISGDLERRTLYPLLAKPLGRGTFVTGKFIGLTVVLVVLTLGMTVGVMGVLLFSGQPLHLGSIVQTAIAIALHAMVCGGLALMFSCFTSTTLASIFGLSVALIGHLIDSLAYFASKSQTLAGQLLLATVKILPNLSLLNLKTVAAHSQTIAWTDLANRAGYAVAYAAALVSLGTALFSRQDLK